MKFILSVMLLSFSFNSFATGGFHCVGKIRTADVQVDINVSGSTSRMEGSPLLGNLLVDIDGLSDLKFEIPKERIVGYWSNDNFLMINTIDSELMHSEIQLNYNTKINKGIMVVNFQGIKATTKNVKCEIE